MRAPRSSLPIVLENVSYAAGGTAILKDVTLSILSGGPAIVLGPNGSGKTTVLKLAMGLLAPASGRISWAGRTETSFGRRAFVFQRPVMLRRSAGQNVAYALRAAGREAAQGRVNQLLEQVGLAGMNARPARRLSGGEQQRLALAKALARDPEVLFLDEPAASLDPASAKAVEDIIRRCAATGVKVVMSTHDLAQARRLAAYVIFLVAGRLVEASAPCRFFEAPVTDEARRFLAGEIVV
ncbi:MAG: ATP-binding cassette domain-containing protein [Rhodomicrobium sp.]|nr:ATP-binding cassette domain-containing protein [Rhodomicrobium sp.]